MKIELVENIHDINTKDDPVRKNLSYRFRTTQGRKIYMIKNKAVVCVANAIDVPINIEELKKFPDNYFGSVVTDPPYGLSFMGKKWDYDVPSVELWKEVFRVLKEGGHLLAFAGTRTQHRMAVNIEDAGFEIRDMIAWVYGSGFPKSHNIGKAVDKLQGNEREILGEIRQRANSVSSNIKMNASKEKTEKITKGYSEWEGWGTALKPALEPITMARKPFKTTVAENVLKNGVGGINIDGCRVETKENLNGGAFSNNREKSTNKIYGEFDRIKEDFEQPAGRFPANFIHDGSDEVKDLFPNSKDGVAVKKNLDGRIYNKIQNWGHKAKKSDNIGYNSSGSASRFFYCAKASKQDREEGLEDFEEKENIGALSDAGKNTLQDRRKGNPRKNTHPTVKPTDLMRYLVRLVTPKNEIVLDCFMGSGSTGKACALEGLSFVGIDLDKDYCKIAKARIDKALEDKRIMDSQTKLF